jgi:hypothetical protein
MRDYLKKKTRVIGCKVIFKEAGDRSVVEEGLVYTCGATWCSWMQGKEKGIGG